MEGDNRIVKDCWFLCIFSMKSVCSYLRLIIKCCILRSRFGIFVVFSFVGSGMLRLNIHRNTSDVLPTGTRTAEFPPLAPIQEQT